MNVRHPAGGPLVFRTHAWSLGLLLLMPIASFAPAPLRAQEAVAASPDTASAAIQKPSRFYYGGSLGFSLSGDVLLITVQPLVGYKLSPKASLGVRISTQYVSDRHTRPSVTALNYGGSLFTRYRVTRLAFAQAEFELESLDLADARETVPFLLLGGGYVRPLAPKTSLVVEILYDLLQDDRALYHRDRGPRVNVGIGLGF